MLIGLYKNRDPFKTMRKERLEAMAKEALAQDVDLVVFDSSCINFSLEQIKGKKFNGEQWVDELIPYPAVVINELPPTLKNRSELESRFRRCVQLTTYLIGGKTNIYEKLATHAEYKSLVIPSYRVQSAQDVFNLFEQHPELVIKPTGGRQGKGVFYLQKSVGAVSTQDDLFVIQDHTSVRELDKGAFFGVIDILIKDQNYMAQPYVSCRTQLGEPYDFRIHVQRGRDGEWAVTKSYPRMGDNKSILSNISRGGRTEAIESFLPKEFGEQAAERLQQLHKTALGVARYINRFYTFQLDELGVDLAIDTSGHMWLYEVNTGPQTRYHEAERAVHTIAYAKHLTEKHEKLVFDNDLPVVALLTGREGDTALKQASHQAALAHNANFYYFLPSGIQKNRNYIYGYIYESGQRRYRQLPLPTVVYDRLRMRGFEKYNYVYLFLDGRDIPFSISLKGGSLSKEKMYQVLDKWSLIKDHVIPYKIVKSSADVIEFLDKYQSVVIKPLQSSFGAGVVKIENIADSDMVYVHRKGTEVKIGKIDLPDLINRFWLNRFVVQRFIRSYNAINRPFDIRVHLVRGADKKLHIAQAYARIGAANVVISNISAGGYVRKLDHFLQDEFSHSFEAEDFKNKIMGLIDKCKKIIDDEYGLTVPDVGLDIAVDENKNLWIFEYNTNRPDTVFHEYEVANLIIPYLIEKSKFKLAN